MTALSNGTAARRVPWRWIGWGAAAALLALPAVAMQFTDEVNWTASDFVFAAVIFGTVGGAYELLLRMHGSIAYRAGAALSLLVLFLLVWVNLAVGIIGNEQDDANMIFAGVIAVAIGGAIVAHFRPRGMSRAALAAAMAQLLVGGIALAGRLGAGSGNWPKDVIGVTIVFTGLWLGAAALFHRAASRGGG